MIKLPFKKPDHDKPRPYWHVDAKWVCAILFAAALVVTLPILVVYKITNRGPATEILAYTMVGLTSPQGIDNEEGLVDIKSRVLQNGSETVTLGGVEVVFTAQDFNTLSPRGLRLKVFRSFAERFYDQGAENLAKSQGLDEASIKKFKNDASLLTMFGSETHKRIGGILLWVILADVALMGALVLFSYRFGRLASPGVVLLLVGLPGIIFAVISSHNPEVAGAARSEDVTSNSAALSTFASYVSPLIIPYFASVYLTALKLGGGMLGLAAVGKIVYSFTRGKHSKDQKGGQDSDEKAEAEKK